MAINMEQDPTPEFFKKNDLESLLKQYKFFRHRWLRVSESPIRSGYSNLSDNHLMTQNENAMELTKKRIIEVAGEDGKQLVANADEEVAEDMKMPKAA